MARQFHLALATYLVHISGISPEGQQPQSRSSPQQYGRHQDDVGHPRASHLCRVRKVQHEAKKPEDDICDIEMPLLGRGNTGNDKIRGDCRPATPRQGTALHSAAAIRGRIVARRASRRSISCRRGVLRQMGTAVALRSCWSNEMDRMQSRQYIVPCVPTGRFRRQAPS